MTLDLDHYEALKRGAGSVRLVPWTMLRVRGADRLSFLHSFCTANVKQLQPGQVTEAFVLNEKGKTLAWVHLLVRDDAVWISCSGDLGEILISHLDKYVIREDVSFEDLSQQQDVWFICGAAAEAKLSGVGNLPREANRIVGTDSCLGHWIAHLDLAGMGWLLVSDSALREDVTSKMATLGIRLCSEEALEAVRIENQTPRMGLDVDVDNLPQELGRDDMAISFDKGCYLGQETVARIDAIGRVNWCFVGLEFDEGSVPQVGEKIEHDGKAAIRVTSAAFSPDHQRHLGLGFARREFSKAGTRVGSVTVRGQDE